MRVLLSTRGSRGDVEPMAALAVRLLDLGADARVCAPPDEEFAEVLARAGVPLVPVGRTARSMVTGPTRFKEQDMAQRAAEMVAATFDTIAAAAAEGADAVVATGMFPAVAGARTAADKLGLRYFYTCFQPAMLPSPHHPPFEYPGRPHPAGVTDNRALWDLDIENMNVLFGGVINAHRTSIGLPALGNVRDHLLTDRPWLATDPVLSPWVRPADLDVVQTGAWILPDERPLPAGLETFLDAGTPPVYVGFGSMPMTAAQDVARVAVEAVRAQGHRVLLARGWAGLAPIDDAADCFAVGEVNQQALFRRVAAVVHHGGAGTTTAAARAGTPQVVVPQMVDQPYYAGRVAELGNGVAHDGPVPTFASLSAALGTALDARTRARAADVAGQVQADGAMTAAKLLFERA
ncbi:vancomycin aglycone glucosyltransferase [Nonomuraea thailandensis]|uniref:Vancomycin aglycone glucosyltransferase n=1 Tax=Nonomuraea thailandensis TaxID=1188745 RepID=A0A9X2GYB2_9ACTN|nr:glycosyltransferase [Nonomuraea thailandensis]MCP2362578.1 vancomycin aglycone glucosyltransferase [Nonomuraea thailandensis]